MLRLMQFNYIPTIDPICGFLFLVNLRFRFNDKFIYVKNNVKSLHLEKNNLIISSCFLTFIL